MKIKEEWNIYPPFLKWFSKGEVYILSDPHFADPDRLSMDPAWISPEEQLQFLNETMGEEDTFICLGDVGDLSYAAKIRAGYKVLLMGNHDEPEKMEAYRKVFDEVYSGPLLISEHLMLSHEPVYRLPWLFALHGHLHSKNPSPREGENHVNLAANVWGYHPAKLSEFLDRMVEMDFPSVHVCLKDQ